MILIFQYYDTFCAWCGSQTKQDLFSVFTFFFQLLTFVLKEVIVFIGQNLLIAISVFLLDLITPLLSVFIHRRV